MKASTLIAQLQDIIAEKGDIQVLVSSDPEGNGFGGFGPDKEPLGIMYGNVRTDTEFIGRGYSRRRLVGGKPNKRNGAVALFPIEQINPEF